MPLKVPSNDSHVRCKVENESLIVLSADYYIRIFNAFYCTALPMVLVLLP